MINRQSDKTVVITGATKGLGKELSLSFAKAGYEVIGLYRSDRICAKVIESEFKANGFQGVFLKQDITEDGDWAEFDEIIKKCAGKKITLIANACLPFVPKPFHLIEWDEISEQFKVNVKGTFSIVKRLLPLMVKRREGMIISILTTALELSPKGFGAYITAKSALEGLTKSISAEYAPRGIKVFSVSPGFMETSLTQDWSGHLKALIYSADKNFQQPDKVAAAILELAQNPDTQGKGENYLIGETKAF